MFHCVIMLHPNASSSSLKPSILPISLSKTGYTFGGGNCKKVCLPFEKGMEANYFLLEWTLFRRDLHSVQESKQGVIKVVSLEQKWQRIYHEFQVALTFLKEKLTLSKSSLQNWGLEIYNSASVA